MPIYSYLCQHCGHSFDQFQHFTDDALTVCPACNEVALRKVYTPVGIVFKGKGFYATDNRSPSGQSQLHNKPDSSSESKTGNEKTPEKTPPAEKKTTETSKAAE